MVLFQNCNFIAYHKFKLTALTLLKFTLNRMKILVKDLVGICFGWPSICELGDQLHAHWNLFQTHRFRRENVDYLLNPTRNKNL